LPIINQIKFYIKVNITYVFTQYIKFKIIVILEARIYSATENISSPQSKKTSSKNYTLSVINQKFYLKTTTYYPINEIYQNEKKYLKIKILNICAFPVRKLPAHKHLAFV
jgi:hypothetical protein